MNGTLNKVMLIGNVGRDVEVFYFDDKSVIARFPLATSEVYRDPAGQKVERTEWHRIVARNQIAEIFKRYLKKGDKIYIEGKIRTREYTDREGIKKYYTEIHVQHFTFLSPKTASHAAADNQAGNRENQAANTSGDVNTQQASAGTDFQNDQSENNPFAGDNNGDDLPF